MKRENLPIIHGSCFIHVFVYSNTVHQIREGIEDI